MDAGDARAHAHTPGPFVTCFYCGGLDYEHTNTNGQEIDYCCRLQVGAGHREVTGRLWSSVHHWGATSVMKNSPRHSLVGGGRCVYLVFISLLIWKVELHFIELVKNNQIQRLMFFGDILLEHVTCGHSTDLMTHLSPSDSTQPGAGGGAGPGDPPSSFNQLRKRAQRLQVCRSSPPASESVWIFSASSHGNDTSDEGGVTQILGHRPTWTII